MIDYILNILKENTLAQGGLVLGVFSGLLYYLRKIPALLVSAFKRRCTSFIQLDSQQTPLKWMLVWLSKTSYGEKTQHLTVRDDDGTLTIGSGTHWFFRKRKLVIVSYTRERIQVENFPIGMKETIDMRIIPGNRQLMYDILQEAKESYEEDLKKELDIYMPRYEHWNNFDSVPKRGMSSVILTKENADTINRRLNGFINSKKFCHKMNIPWRLSFLLYGPPGNGKSSLAAAIASQMGYDLYILSLNGIESDRSLLSLCADIGENSVLLIEDIDAYNIQRENENNTKVTLSGVLNALDGVTAKDGRITIMTTNYPDRLDAALTRKGRADIHLELKAPNRKQLEELFGRFGRPYNEEEFSSMVDAQDFILTTLNESDIL